MHYKIGVICVYNGYTAQSERYTVTHREGLGSLLLLCCNNTVQNHPTFCCLGRNSGTSKVVISCFF